MAVSGMGMKDREAAWENRIQGSIRTGRGIILLMLKAWNFMACMGEKTAFPVPVASGPGAAEALEQLEYGAESPGVALPQSTTLGIFEGPHTPDQIYKLWEYASERFAGHFGQPVLAGERSPGEPASSYLSREASAGLPFGPVKVSLEQAFGEMFEHKLEMVKYVLQEAVTVEGVTMRPRDVVDGTQIMINMTPLTQQEKAEKRLVAQDDLKLGAGTVEDYIRTQNHVSDAAAVQTAAAAEKLRDMVQA